MSLTRSARAPNSAASWRGRPNSLTRVAPGAEKRSVICVVIAALCAADWRCKRPTRAPMRRAGMTNVGSSRRARSVTCQLSPIITISVRVSVMTLTTTPDRAEVNARWAPSTSLFRRLTRAPVRVRVKKAMGICWTCSKTRRRRSRISPSPRREDCQRSSRPTPASTTATPAMISASTITVDVPSPSTMASTARPASTGARTPSPAETVAKSRKATIVRRWGRANSPIRRHDCRLTTCPAASSWRIALCSADHELKSVMEVRLRVQPHLNTTSS